MIFYIYCNGDLLGHMEPSFQLRSAPSSCIGRPFPFERTSKCKMLEMGRKYEGLDNTIKPYRENPALSYGSAVEVGAITLRL